MKKLFLFLSFLLFSIYICSENIIITYEDIIATNYSSDEATFTNTVDFGYVNIIRNNTNGTPSGWAKNQVIQAKGSDGILYNKNEILNITNIRVYVVVYTNTFKISYGSTIDCNDGTISRPTTATGTEDIVYSGYDSGTITPGLNGISTYYDFDLSETKPSYFKITPGSNNIYIWKIIITCGSITHTINWIANNDTLNKTQVIHNSNINNIPYINVNNYCGNTFVGWTNQKYYSNEKPDMFFNNTPQSPIITSDTTFYAIFGNRIYEKKNIEDLTSDDIFMIIGKNGNGYYALPNNKGSHNPNAVHINNINDTIYNIVDTLLWNISGNSTDGYTFYPNGVNTKWLYLLPNNNEGVRVAGGSGSDKKIFTINNGYLYTTMTTTPRYIGIYDNQDWRCYTSINANIKNQTFGFYALTDTIDYHTACIREFNNNSNNLWTTKENWTNNKLPSLKYTAQINNPVIIDTTHALAKNIVLSESGKITIQPNKALEVDSTITIHNGLQISQHDLILESSSAGNASLIFKNDNNSKATVQLYSKAYIDGNTWNWQYVGTPFIGSIPLYNYYGSWMYKWYNGWNVVHGGDELIPFNGYCITQESATTYTMEGTLVSTEDDIEIEMPINTDMVLANSWTAPIYIGGFNNETFTSSPATIYLFNTGMAENGSSEYISGDEAGTYITVPVNAAEYTGNEFIAPMQGFFVTTHNGKAGTIILKYDDLVRSNNKRNIVAGSMRSPKHTQSNERLKEKPVVLKIFVNGTNYCDKVIILEREDFSEEFDNGWDGEKISFGNESPSIYVINNNGTYDAVSAIPNYEGTLVGFRPGSDNIYTITFNYNGNDTWYLNDMKEQQSIQINSENSYIFESLKTDNEIRFIISQTPINAGVTTNNEKINETNTNKKFIINNNIYIINNNQILNILGNHIK